SPGNTSGLSTPSSSTGSPGAGGGGAPSSASLANGPPGFFASMAQAALQEWYTETDPVLDAIGSVLGTRANNFLAGFGDTVTCNGTQKIRVLMGTDDTVDKTSSAYANGRTTGKAYN